VLGCDLEVIEPRSDAFVSDYFTADERALVARAAWADQPRVVTLLWSAKESALKALGVGLRLDTRCVQVSPADGQDTGFWYPMQVRHDGQIFRGWWQSTGSLLRTLVAAPPPRTPAPVAQAFLPVSGSLQHP
jgi:4'-phosphopantetheinyl transferase